MRRRNQISTEVRIGPSDLQTMCGIDANEGFTLKTVTVDQYGCVAVTFSRQDEAFKYPRVDAATWPRKVRLTR